jgi:hypothetical protein
MTEPLAIRKVVLYKHGVGYFEREGTVDCDAQVELAFKTSEVSDVLKSLTVLDLDGGHVSSISYDATTPAAKLLEDIALDVSDGRGLVGLLPQLQGAEVEVAVGSERVRGQVLGLDEVERRVDASTVLRTHRLALLAAGGETLQVDLEDARSIRLLDEKLRRDLEFYLRTQLAAKKKDARAFTFFAQGAGARRLRISYTLETPVWKATYRILLPEAGGDDEPLVQGWAVVDNTQDEDWTEVDLSLISGLPISFVHDLYSARYLRRPVVEVREQSALAPPVVEEAMYDMMAAEAAPTGAFGKMAARTAGLAMPAPAGAPAPQPRPVSSVDVQTRERQVGDLFQYTITRPVTIKRNQSALVPIVLKPFRGRSVLLYNPATRDRNPLSAVEFENTTGLTLEGGPVTVIEGETYVGEAMVESIKPVETRLIPYSVELGVLVDSTMQSTSERVHRTRVTRGTLFTYSMERRRTVYQFANKSGRPRTVYVEHRRDYGWELVETPAPHETTPNLYRFRTELPAAGPFELAVAERHEISSAFALANVTPDVVADYRSARYIDDRVAGVLGTVVELKERAARVDAQTSLVVQELGAITNDQQRIRENLKSIGESHDEKRLRTTFVEKLGAQEQRIEELTESHRALATERQQIQYDIDASIAGLEFETDVP